MGKPGNPADAFGLFAGQVKLLCSALKARGIL
jgi:hypothetical protein